MSIRDVAESYLASFASADPVAVAAHVTDDFENIQVSELGSGCSGRDSYRERLADFLASFEDLRYAISELISERQTVVAAYTMRFKSDGRDFEIEGVMIMTFRGELIASRKDYWDGLTFQKQAAD